MRLTAYAMLTMFSVTLTHADQVTPDEALQQARQFFTQQRSTPGGPRKANAQEPQLKMESQICGLYVFNVADGGFVIVSNDDATEPILGFSNSGSIDPANIPDNMRAWLQGYADQINWLRQNGASAAARTKVIRKSIEEKHDIAALIQTKWDQGNPYNLYCPKDKENGERCVTGCVATAMAQVMYYHKCPATMFKWSKMNTTYAGDETLNDESAEAVASLMYNCGYWVDMNWGAEMSSAQSSQIVNALTGLQYNTETVKILSRNYYSYENWVNLIYNELEQRRPVIYSGSTPSGAGHAFICDGYKSENNKDYFHINWGWSGHSDDYFLLSALNPFDQGIGSSDGGYNYGQNAIVGIQKATESGTVLNVQTKEISFSLESITASHSEIALGESVDITCQIINNSADEYDGELTILGKRNNGNEFFERMVTVPGNGTVTHTFTCKPSGAGEYKMHFAVPQQDGSVSYNPSVYATVTVKDQTPTNVSVNPSSESATVSWTNTGNADKWNLSYREASTITWNFDNTSGWSISNTNHDETSWQRVYNSGIDNSSCYRVPSYSWTGTSDDYGDWLITPEITFGGTISFYAWSPTGNQETCSILFSTDGNYFSEYSDQIVVTSEQKRYSFDISGLSGKGRIAIAHHSTSYTADAYMYVDNVSYTQPTGEWQTIENVTSNPYTLTGLDPASLHTVKVQAAHNDGGNWSESVMFETTNDLTLLNDDSKNKNMERIEKWKDVHADVTLDGRTILCNGSWNTLCLPFQFYAELLRNSVPALESSTITIKVLDTEKTKLSDGVLTLAFKTTNSVKPGMPFIIKCESSTAPSSIDLSEYPISTGITSINDVISRMTQTSEDGNVKFVGQWTNFDITDNNIKEILYIASGNKIGYAKSPRTLKSMRAHFWVQPENKEAAARAIRLDWGDGEVTSIDLMENDAAAGQSEWYTVDGRRIEGQPASKGVYVSKGKKVVITK